MAGNGNYATWNRAANVNPGLSYSGFVLDKGEIRFRGNTGGTSSITSTLSMPSGKWYVEVYAENNAVSGWPTLGVLKTDSISKLQNVSNYQSYTSGTANDRSEVTLSSGDIRVFGSTSGAATGSGQILDGDILNIAVDIDAGKWWFGKNGTYMGSGNPAAGSNAIDTFTAGTELSIWTAGYNGSSYLYINAGQDSTFSGNVSAGTGVDDNGFGNFKYAPPSGFLALCSSNLSVDANIDPGGDDGETENPSEQFGVVKNTGTGSATTVTGLGMQPDLIWAKRTDGSRRHYIVDSVRGFTKYLHPEGSYSEGTSSTGITSVNTDGFVIGGGLDYINTSSSNYISWCWRGNGGTTASNGDGNVTTTISANPAAGFSIVSWTGTGTNSRTLGTGLTKEVEWFMVKNRDSGSYPFICYHYQANGGSQPNDYGILNMSNTNGYSEGSGALTYWDISEFSSSVFSVGGDPGVNGSGNNMIAYCWHGVEGYSKFGSYIAGGNADGPFIYTGFKPKMVMIKGLVSGAAWIIRDDTLDGYNPGLGVLQPNSDAAKYTTAGGVCDILSNGFKVRTNNAVANSTSYDPYVYMAWGSPPFKYNNTIDQS